MSAPTRPLFQRHRYWQGQKLRSRDFNDQLAVANEMRWWHNRALHNTYGVIQGLEVIETSTPGQLIVAPGLAYDCYGRELLLFKETSVSAPTSPEKQTLVIRYRSTASTIATDRLQTRAPEQGELVWILTDKFHFSDGVPLLNVQWGDPLPFNAPVARALSRPLIANGQTILGQTDWQGWRWPVRQTAVASESILADERTKIGVEVTIDTSAAGFTAVPCYFATLQSRDGIWNQAGQGLVPMLLERVLEERADRFTFSLLVNLATFPHLVHRRLSQFNNRWLLSLVRHNLYVTWLGIQMPLMSETTTEVDNGLS